MRDDFALRVEHELFMRSFFMVQPPPEVAKQLSSKVKDFRARAGTVIYEEGAPADFVYFVIEGGIRLQTDDAEPWDFKESDVIGILDAVLDRPRSRTAVALTDVHALVLDAQDYFDVLEDHFEFTKLALNVVSTTLHDLALGLAPTRVFSKDGAPECAPVSTANLSQVEILLVLRSTPLFERAPVQALVRLATLCRQQHLGPGARLFSRGAPSSDLYVLTHGEVALARENPTVRARFGPGDLVGRFAELGAEVHLYDATATSPCSLLRIDREDLLDVMEDHMALARSAFAYLAVERERVMHDLAIKKKEAGSEDSVTSPALKIS